MKSYEIHVSKRNDNLNHLSTGVHMVFIAQDQFDDLPTFNAILDSLFAGCSFSIKEVKPEIKAKLGSLTFNQ